MRLLSGYRACAQRGVSTRHVDILDGVRVLAILIVAWFHIWQQSWMWPNLRIGGFSINLTPLVRTGYIMVDVMLLISGFLLFLPYARHMLEGEPLPSVKDFFVKRALRILPSYLLCVFSVLFLFALPARDYVMDARLWEDLLRHLSFTHVFSRWTYQWTELNVVLWTLAIEVQFYLIFPLVARAFTKWTLPTWFLMVVAGVAFRDFAVRPQPNTDLWVNQLPAFLDVYANGMLASICYVHLARTLKHNRWTRLACTLLALVMAFLIWQLAEIHNSSGALAEHLQADSYEMIRIFQARYRFQLSAYACVFILAAANAGAGLRYLLSNGMMRVLSAVSFHYYMWHQFLAAKMHDEWHFPPSPYPYPNEVPDKTWQWLFTVCAFGFPLVLSLILTYGFERPIARMGWGAWMRHKRRVELKMNQVKAVGESDQ